MNRSAPQFHTLGRSAFKHKLLFLRVFDDVAMRLDMFFVPQRGLY